MNRLDLSQAKWQKSSYSGDNGGQCIEVADGFPGVVPVRDSKNPSGPAIVVTSAAWVPFVENVKVGDLST